MKIRKAKQKDIEQLIKIVKGVRSIEDYPGEYNYKYFEKMFKNKDLLIIVAEVDGKVIGFHEIEIDKDSKRIFGKSLAVFKEYRGRGVGVKLFEYLENYAKDRSFRRISLLVRDWNKPMNNLAKKKKFKISDKFYLWEKVVK